jgi:hypothetical protein
MFGGIFKFVGSLFTEDEATTRKRWESAEFQAKLRSHNRNTNSGCAFLFLGGTLFVFGGIALKVLSWIFHFEVPIGLPLAVSLAGLALMGVSYVFDMNNCRVHANVAVEQVADLDS